MNQLEFKEACKFLSNLPMIIGGLDGKATFDEIEQIHNWMHSITMEDCKYSVLMQIKQAVQNLAEKYDLHHFLVMGLWTQFDDENLELEISNNSFFSLDLLEYLASCAFSCSVNTTQFQEHLEQVLEEVKFDSEALQKLLSVEEKQQLSSIQVAVHAESDSTKKSNLLKQLGKLQDTLHKKYLGDSSTIQ